MVMSCVIVVRQRAANSFVTRLWYRFARGDSSGLLFIEEVFE